MRRIGINIRLFTLSVFYSKKVIMSTKIRNKVKCDCKEYDGKYVEERTRKRHIELEHRLASNISGFVSLLPNNNCDKPAHTILEIDDSLITEGSLSLKQMVEQEETTSLDSNYELDFTTFIPQKDEDKTSFENQKSTISMKIQVMMRLIT